MRIGWLSGLLLAGVVFAESSPTIINEALPNGSELESYHATLSATNGIPPYRWGVEEIAIRAISERDPSGDSPVNNAVAMSGVFGNMLFLQEDGSIVSWHSVGYDELEIPEDLPPVMDIAASTYHSLALTRKGRVIGWGSNDDGQLDVPETNDRFIDIAAGQDHSIGLTEKGRVYVWGQGAEYGDLRVPFTMGAAKAIAAAYKHNLALMENGTVLSWGDREDVPDSIGFVHEEYSVTEISAGSYHDLALLSDGRVVAWGNNDSGQCDVPSNLSDVVAISAEGSLSVALLSDGSTVAWGHDANFYEMDHVVSILVGSGFCLGIFNKEHQLPDGLSVSPEGVISGVPTRAGEYDVNFLVSVDQHGDSYVPGKKTLQLTIDANNVSRRPVISAAEPRANRMDVPEGGQQLFSVTAAQRGTLLTYRWTVDGVDAGSTDRFTFAPAYGDLGLHRIRCYVSDSVWQNVVFHEWDVWVYDILPAVLNEALPRGVERMPYFAQLEATNGPAPYTWRLASPIKEYAGRVGFEHWLETMPTIPEPAAEELYAAVDIDSGFGHNLALLSDGTVRAWGRNDGGQAEVPAGLKDVVAIAADCLQSLAVKADGSVVAWGRLMYSNNSLSAPISITNAVDVAGSRSSSYALLEDGRVYSWRGTSERFVDGLEHVVAIDGGEWHLLALKNDGTVEARGCGNMCHVPEDLTNVIDISAGTFLSMALKDDGTVVVWGNGRDEEFQPTVPTFVPEGLANVKAIAAGSDYHVALKNDGSIVTWGYDLWNGEQFPDNYQHIEKIAAGYHTLALVGMKSRLPEGLQITEDGVVMGTSEYAGTYDVAVMVQDAQGDDGIKQLRLQMEEHPNKKPIIIAASPENERIKTALEQSQLFTVTSVDPEGQTIAYRWEIDDLVVSDNVSSQYVFDATEYGLGMHRVRCYVSDGFWHERVYQDWQIEVTPYASPLIMTEQLPLGAVMTPYDLQLQACGGVPPYTFYCNTKVSMWAGASFDTVDLSNYSDFIDISAGGRHTVGLTREGEIVQWDANGVVQKIAIPERAVQIASSYALSMALLEDGSIVSWYANARVEALPLPAGSAPAIAIAAGGKAGRAILLADGIVVRLNRSDTSKEFGNVQAIACEGSSGIWVLLADGSVVDWEKNVVTGVSNLTAIAAGSAHCLGLTSGGEVVAWGSNQSGQCNVPAGLSDVIAVRAGSAHSLALKSDGTLVAWGDNSNGQCSVPEELSNICAFAGGWIHSVALSHDQSCFPEGLQISSTGRISGTPMAPFSGYLTFTVRDSRGLYSSKELFLAVPMPENRFPPAIDSVVPDYGPIELGEGASRFFSVTANDRDGDVLSYTWSWKEGAEVSGDLGHTLTTTWGDAGTQQLICSVSDGFWPPVSYAWQVTVLDDNDGDGVLNASELFAGTNPNDPSSLFTMKTPQVAAGQPLVVRFRTVPGRSYRVLYTEDLAAAWLPASDVIVASEELTEWTVLEMGFAAFYRVVVLPES